MNGEAEEAVDSLPSRNGATLEDKFFEGLRKACVPVSCYLTNGIKLEGRIDAADESVVYLKGADVTMVYKHAISSVVRTRATASEHLKAPKRTR